MGGYFYPRRPTLPTRTTRPSPFSYTRDLDALYRVPPPSLAQAAATAPPEPEEEPQSAIGKVLAGGWDATKGILNVGSAAVGLAAASPDSSYNLTRAALSRLPGRLDQYLPDTTAAYGRALQENTDAVSDEGTRDLSIGEILSTAPGPGQVGAEALLPGRRETAAGRITKNVGSLVGDLVLDPTILASGGLSAATKAAKEGRLLRAGAEVLGSAPAAAVYGPDIVRGTYESGRQAVDAVRDGRPSDAIEPGIQALMTGGLGLLMGHGVVGEVRGLRAPSSLAEAAAREAPPSRPEASPVVQEPSLEALPPARATLAPEVIQDHVPAAPVAPDAALEALAAVPPPSAAAFSPDVTQPINPSEALRDRLAREGAAEPQPTPATPLAPEPAAALPPNLVPPAEPAPPAPPASQAPPPAAAPQFAYRARNVGEQGVPAVSHAQASLSEADVRRVAPSRTEEPQEVVRIPLDKLDPADYEVIERPGQPAWVRFTRELPEAALERVGPVDAVDVAAASKAEPAVTATVAQADTADLAQVAGLSIEQARKGAEDVIADGVREFSPEAVAIKRAVIAGQVDVPATMARRQTTRGKALPKDERGQQVYPGEEALSPDEREALNGVVAARVRELEMAQKSQPTGRRPILAGPAMNDVVGYQGTPSHKVGTAFEGIPEGPKEIVDAHHRDKGNALELRLRDAVLKNDPELADHFDQLAERQEEGDDSFDVTKYAVRPAPGQRGIADIADDVPAAAERREPPKQASLFGKGDMLQGVEARTTEGRERDGALFNQERAARSLAEAAAQTEIPREAGPQFPPRTADTMSDAIAISSPNGRMSGRAKDAATRRLGEALFGSGGATREQIMGGPTPQPSARERDLTQARRLRDLAARGMSAKKYTREAERLEGLHAEPAPKDGPPSAGEPKYATMTAKRPPVEADDLGFFSQLERAADALPQAMRGADALRYLQDPKRGIKADELKWTGVDDFLKERAGQKVTPEELRAFVRENRVEVKEAVQGAPDEPVEIEWKDDADFPGEVFNGRGAGDANPRYVIVKETKGPRAGQWTLQDHADLSINVLSPSLEDAKQRATILLGRERRKPTKFDQYTLPGGENYREVLLTLPKKGVSPEMAARVHEAGKRSRALMERLDAVRDTPGEADVRRELSTANADYERLKAEGIAADRTFQSGHFEEPNVLAHVRLNDRTDADGKRVLFVEEIQSDWAQKGRRSGFDDGVDRATEVQDRLNEIQTRFDELHGERTEPAILEERRTLANEHDDLIHELRALKSNDKVPSAPFVDSTEKWTDLALKRVMRMAAEGGYDRVAWTTGEQQSARYDLSKHIDSITWRKFDDGTVSLTAQKDGRDIVADDYDQGELPDVIGKDLSDRIATEIDGGKTANEYSGLDLKVGGEGMRGFYDKIVPQRMAALGKKWGTKVGEAFVDDGSMASERLIAKSPEIYGTERSRHAEIAGRGVPVHSIDVTPAMRESVLAGQPKFATAPKLPADSEPRAAGVPREVVAKAFPTGKLSDHPEGGHLVTLPGERQIRVDQVGNISYNPAAFKAGYGRRLKPGETLAGAWRQIDRGGLIQLAKDAPVEPTLLHESFHAAMDLALNDAEHAAVLKRYGTEEKAADAYGSWIPAKQTNSWFSKIFSFARNLVRSFSPTWESTFERVRSGKAFEGPGRAPKPAPAAGGAPPKEPPGPRPRPIGLEPEAAEAGARHGGKSKGRPPETLINLDRIAEPKDVRELEGRVQEALRERGHDARSYRSWDEARDRAVESGLTEGDVKRLLKEKGSLTDVEIEAGRMLRESAFRDMRDKLETMRKLQIDGKDYGEAERAYNLAAAKAAGIMLTTVRAGGEAGRALAIHRKMSTAMTEAEAARWRAKLADPDLPAAEKYAIQKRLEQATILNEREQLLQRALKEMPGSGSEFATRLLQTPEGDHRAIAALLRAEFRPGLKSKAFEIWVNSLLSAPPTQLANVTGNAITQLLRIPEKAMAGALDAAKSAVTGRPRDRFVGEAYADVMGIREGVRKGLRAMRSDWAEEFGGKDSGKLEHQVGAIGGRLGSLVRTPGRALSAMDEFFKAVAATRESRSLSYRKARAEGKTGKALSSRIEDILANLDSHPEILDGMQKAADYQTFTNKLGKFGQMMVSARDADPTWISRVVVPFMRTPLNVAKYGAERTPLNFLRILADPKLRNAEELAKPVVGTMLGLSFAMAAQEGLITGGGPADPKENDLLRSTGWQPYSLKVGDNYVSYQRLEPLASIIGSAADIVEAKDEHTQGDLVNKIAGSVADNWSNKTFWQGAENLSQALSDPRRYMAQYAKSLQGSLVPAVVARAAQAIDPTVRETSASDGSAIAARLPGVSTLLEPKRRGTGEPIQRGGTALERFASPLPRTTEKGKDADLERAFLAADFVPSSPQRFVTIPKALGGRGQRIELSDADLRYLRDVDERVTQRLREVVDDKRFARMDQLAQKQYFRRLYDQAGDAALKRLWSQRELRQRAAQQLRETSPRA